MRRFFFFLLGFMVTAGLISDGAEAYRVKWKFKTGGHIWWGMCPAITEDGRIYFGSDDDYLYCLDLSGNLICKYKTGGEVRSAPLIVGDRVIFGSLDGYLYCLDRNTGSLSWRYKTKGDFWGVSPAYNGEYIITGAGAKDPDLYCLDLSGNLVWKKKINQGDAIKVNSSCIGPDGTIYVGTWDGHLYALSSDGIIKWSYETGHWVSTPPAISRDGTVYAGLHGGYFYAINPDGTLKWKLKTGYVPVLSSPAISQDGTIYVGCGEVDGSLYAINPDGSVKWKFKIRPGTSSPAISRDGTIYVGSYAINPDGTLKWKLKTSVIASPTIGPDGTVYFGSFDGYFYAIYDDNGGLASSPWPKFARDLSNTGSLRVLYASPLNSPFLEIGRFELQDADGDGVFSAGEEARVTMAVENSGRGDAYGVKFRFSGLLEKEIPVGRIGKGERVEKRASFRIPLRVSTGKKDIRLTVEAGDYSPETVVAQIYTESLIPLAFSLELMVDDDRAGLSMGDGDHLIEPRETVELRVRIKNVGRGMARGVVLEGRCRDPRIRMVKDRAELGNLPPGGELEGVIAFFVPATYREKEIPFEVQVREETGLWTMRREVALEAGGVSERVYVVKPRREPSAEGGGFRASLRVKPPEGKRGLPPHPLFQSPNRIALVIGVADYENVPKLPCALNDARLIREVARKLLGVPEENLRYLENPTLAEMRKGFRWLVSMALGRKHPEVILYYSGHGATDERGEPYWLPVDADNEARYLLDTGLRLKEVYEKLARIENGRVILIADACFSGKGKGVALKGAKPAVMVVRPRRPEEKFSLLLSSREDQISTYLEDKGYSTFTYALYRTLLGGDVLDRDGDGWLEVYEVKDYLVQKTKELSSEKGIIQMPVVAGRDAPLCPPVR